MTTEKKPHATAAWTEVDYSPRCKNAYIAPPLYIPEETTHYLCRADGTRRAMRLTFVVFRPATSDSEDEWDDDPTIGSLQVCALGDGDEEVAPATVTYLGIAPDEFLTVVHDDDDAVTFSVSWPYGEVSIDKSTPCDDGFTVRKADFGDDGIACRLTPREGEPFAIKLQIPFSGFMLTDPDGTRIEGEAEVEHDRAAEWKYVFTPDKNNDRFSISLDDDKLIYLCVAREDGTLAVRDMRERLAMVAEIGCEGSLADLLMGAHSILVKNRSSRWRIRLTGAALDGEEHAECSPRSLARFAYTQFAAAADGETDALADKLITLEQKLLFQWHWLSDSDWSHEQLDGLIDMEGIDADPEKMMRQALLFNRYETFMQRLAARSLDTQKPIQGDQLQARNNKRKIARCARHVLAHRRGEASIWELDEESRREILHFSQTFHREFMAAIAAD